MIFLSHNFYTDLSESRNLRLVQAQTNATPKNNWDKLNGRQSSTTPRRGGVNPSATRQHLRNYPQLFLEEREELTLTIIITLCEIKSLIFPAKDFPARTVLAERCTYCYYL